MGDEHGISMSSDVREVHGIGRAAEKGLKTAGISTVADLLNLLPRSYIDYTAPLALSADPGRESFFAVSIASVPERYTGRTGTPVLQFQVKDENGDRALVTVFNQNYLLARLRPGLPIFLYGTIDTSGGLRRITAPRVLLKQPDTPLVPVYTAVDGITQSRLRQAIAHVLDNTVITDPHSEAFRRRFRVCGLQEAYRMIHRPQTADEPDKGRRRFHLDSCFTLARVLDSIEARRDNLNDMPVDAEPLLQLYCDKLPFDATTAQLRAMRDIARDLDGPRCMNRLLQGDVGSGKTAVALFAAYCVVHSGYQGMFLAPTEILARQQFESARRLLPADRVFLLTASTTQREWSAIRTALRDGSGALLVGTHALLYRELDLPAPALLITDEQHRFGVRQRSALLGQNTSMHSLTISATPIPRSLALAIHGQTNISVLDERPPGRKRIKTAYVPPRKVDDMFEFIAQRARKGMQAFVVCAAIEPSETTDVRTATEVQAMLSARFPDISIGLLHGRCAPEDKELIMQRFAAGEISVLVSTTVVEVGIDVPKASVMAILDADRFGLAQLHQLRGRVGRGDSESFCFLASNARAARERIRVLCATDDGFRIAEEDLRARGAGDFLGERQHGQASALSILTAENAELLARMRKSLSDMSSDPAFRADFDWFTNQAELEMEMRLTELALN